jgi:hypothetical protein
VKKKIKSYLSNNSFEKWIFTKNQNYHKHIYFVNVHPCSIKYMSLIPERSALLQGKDAKYGYLHGPWDYLKRPFHSHFLYKTVTSILNGKEFEETPLLKKVRIGASTEKEAKRQYDKLKRRIEILIREGYRSQHELNNLDKKRSVGIYKVPLHEILVAMDRKGQLFRIVGGRHRLAIAQQIGIESMPAILTLIHEKAADKLPVKSRLITGDETDFRPFE